MSELSRESKKASKTHKGKEADVDFNDRYFMNHTFSFIIQHPLFNLHTS